MSGERVCVVKLTDAHGVEHRVKVQAESVYEAALLGLHRLQQVGWESEVPAVKYKELRAPSASEDSAAVRQREIAARDRQLDRFRTEKKTYANAQMMPKMIRKHCAISADGEKLLENAITLGLSARAHDRILKVARTIADLDASENIDPRHLSEAIQYRTLDRSYWA
jgi:magnesium chelatase family protein